MKWSRCFDESIISYGKEFCQFRINLIIFKYIYIYIKRISRTFQWYTCWLCSRNESTCWPCCWNVVMQLYTALFRKTITLFACCALLTIWKNKHIRPQSYLSTSNLDLYYAKSLLDSEKVGWNPNFCLVIVGITNIWYSCLLVCTPDYKELSSLFTIKYRRMDKFWDFLYWKLITQYFSMTIFLT